MLKNPINAKEAVLTPLQVKPSVESESSSFPIENGDSSYQPDEELDSGIEEMYETPEDLDSDEMHNKTVSGSESTVS